MRLRNRLSDLKQRSAVGSTGSRMVFCWLNERCERAEAFGTGFTIKRHAHETETDFVRRAEAASGETQAQEQTHAN